MKVAFNDYYIGAGYQFDTTRKAGPIAEALVGLTNIEVVDPKDYVALAEQIIEAIHDEEYLDALRTGEPRNLASSQGFGWCLEVWDMVVNSTAGVLLAVEAALAEGTAGSLSSGLHHARANTGAGFCTINGLAVAIEHAKTLVEGQVVVLDLDAHCGGGTQSFIAGDQRVGHFDLSTARYDGYAPTLGNQLVLLPWEVTDQEYVEAVAAMLADLPTDAGLVLYNAGVDPAPAISADALAEREHLVAAWAKENQVPLAFVLAGGYTSGMTEQELTALHVRTVTECAQVAKIIPRGLNYEKELEGCL